ncbi:MAG: cytochrome c [Myxococcales bacterium]|nr:cytochrome c [Myxococcales bacterium]MCB9544352.1 cytochrome c [Myxococcales bacterium]
MQHLLLLLIAASVLSGCRGEPSAQPPVHLNPNMDTQDKYKPQRESKFFADGRAMRPLVAGTVGRDSQAVDVLGKADDRFLREDDAFWRGTDEFGAPVAKIPVPVTAELVARGQERYGIYCTPCHDRSGYGEGTVPQSKAGLAAVPSYHQDYMRQYADGFIFGVISNGSRSGLMSGYRHQIPAADRWAIVAYVRALQRSQFAAADDVPEAERGKR